ncbi:TSUP family transporter [Vibrio viridaestus]|uniref:Probable membrane transporter protein n=1 Tax=Vibrio viridaestus TaxID=2487322 RepID=A0A3N9TGR0_9VIBR|nr:TSUP family transporter [Vibrio viridaestus]RQW62655.1 hypothetical protein EES38_13090 [Vibrio viridaestus]
MENLFSHYDLWIVLFLLVIAIFAGVVDAIAGGGGLITVPSLMLVGLPPMTVLGTNRLQAVIGELTTSLVYLKSKELPIKGLFIGVIATSVGAILGAYAVSILDKTMLEQLLPFLMVAVTLYSILSKRLKSDQASHPKLQPHSFMITFGLVIGFYNGFFGPGTGSLWMLSFIALLGYTLKQATMATKPLNLIGNVVSLVLFIMLGHVDYQLGLMMAIGQIIGSIIGSKCVLSYGTRMVRPVFISVTIIMTTKLLYENLRSYEQWFY